MNGPSGQIGMDPIGETRSDRERWAAAASKMAMALSEAGYPTRLEMFGLVSGRENELVFLRDFPPFEVARRAGELCGIADLIDATEVNGRLWGPPAAVDNNGRQG